MSPAAAITSAPEVLKGVDVDARADLYSLGLVLYEVTGAFGFVTHDYGLTTRDPACTTLDR